jgi:hypothetical protein
VDWLHWAVITVASSARAGLGRRTRSRRRWVISGMGVALGLFTASCAGSDAGGVATATQTISGSIVGGSVANTGTGGLIGTGLGNGGPAVERIEVLPSRAFAGPTQYPPSRFAAYGIVAFPSRAVPDDIARYVMICEAFVASLPSHLEVRAPIEMQMVTVWPIQTDRDADNLDIASRDSSELCKHAVDSYGLVAALAAINDARRSHAVLDGLGPYLLAWSPPNTKGRANALGPVDKLVLAPARSERLGRRDTDVAAGVTS